ncbi:MAG: hypothetical protein NTW15_04030 [Burkholderiales bacterium]|nr:hypothetical protein [Burkholderiales bacterium]
MAAEPKNLNPAVAKPPPPPAKWLTSGDIGEFRQDLQAEVQRFSGLSIKGAELFPENFIDKIQASESVRLSDNIKGELDREYNAVRFYIGKYPDMNVMSFFMNKTGEVTEVFDLNDGPDAATLAQISAAGGLRPEALGKLGFNQDDVAAAGARNRERKERLASLQVDSVDRLPSSYMYGGNEKNTATVLQGDARIIRPGGSTEGLYTFDAGPCSIVVAVASDVNGQVTQVGMAHVDASTPRQSLSMFLNQTRGAAATLNVHVISGETETALRVHDSIRLSGATIKFADIDPDGSRGDAVVVDKRGKVFYGYRMGLASINEQELKVMALSRQMPNAPLYLRGLP